MEVFVFKIIRIFTGLTFTLKLLERHEKESTKKYKDYLKKLDGKARKRLKKIIYEEEFHEKSVLDEIKEERVEFTGSIVLGVNDSLVEITGALAGLVSVIQNSLLVGFSGLIIGVAAAMSMTASAYLQAKQDDRKSPRKSAFYTGFSYVAVVGLLIFPFFLMSQSFSALALTIVVAIIIASSTAVYTSVLFERGLKKELAEMLVLSMGVAAISFLIGSAVKYFYVM